MPSVDVIVPCYNYGRYLRACVGSILAQDGCDVRVLIIDDASTDDSLRVAQAIAAQEPRVEVVAHARNRGHIATYNEGIAWLSADYMLLLSSDDMLAPMALSRAVGLMEANPDVGFVYGTAIQFADEADLASGLGCRSVPVSAATPAVESGAAFIRRICTRPNNPIETATAVVRRELQQRVGGYRPELPHSADMEMWLRLASLADVGAIQAVQAFTRIHAANMRHLYKPGQMLADYEQRWRAFDIFFEGQPASELKGLARRALAEQALWAGSCAYEEADDPAAPRLVAFARAIDPSVTRTAIWWKTAVKRKLGWERWRRIAPLLEALGLRKRRHRSGATPPVDFEQWAISRDAGTHERGKAA